MKKIINGKMYNTETAAEVASYSNDCARNDFHYFEQTLYRKKTGEFFLYGEGGGLSMYARREFDGWTYGVRIDPLTEAEAKEWMEKHADVEDYIDVFGEPEE